jgi:hypothetical protein
LDTEWLLSTLFDASLLSTSKAAGNGGSFFAPSFRRARLRASPESMTTIGVYEFPACAKSASRNDESLETIFSVVTGLFVRRAQ